jgi:signal transduction histidine kinase
MFSKKANAPEASAAWRIAIWPTVAFAVGSAAVLSIIYLLIARDIRARSDAWLTGETAVLADVAENTPRDALYQRLVEEVAELASREVPDASDATGQRRISVFFLKTSPGLEPIWVGPTPKEQFIRAVSSAKLLPTTPGNVRVEGWRKDFRVVYHPQNDGGGLYLGFADLAAATMLDSLAMRCLMVWGLTVALGFAITWLVAYRTLARVERITETVSRIGSEDLSRRLPEGPHPDEISRLSHTFNRMLDRVQSSVRQTRILTDSVAHDLKNPVTSIRGDLEVALADDSHDHWREHVAQAIDGLDRLAQMLNTTLDLAEASAGILQLRKQPVDLAEAVNQMTDLYHAAMTENQHELLLQLKPVVVEADASLLHRVLANLLDNEVAHLPPGCRIRICLCPKNGEAELTVEDNGPGFSPTLRQRAFEPSVKGEASSGHGLGLAFVHAAVQAHGGHVEIADREGGGAVIVLTLPLAETMSVPAAAAVSLRGREL